jgi:hypothetical protein
LHCTHKLRTPCRPPKERVAACDGCRGARGRRLVQHCVKQIVRLTLPSQRTEIPLCEPAYMYANT